MNESSLNFLHKGGTSSLPSALLSYYNHCTIPLRDALNVQFGVTPGQAPGQLLTVPPNSLGNTALEYFSILGEKNE